MKKHTLQRALRVLAGATDTKSHAPAFSAVLMQNDGPGHVLLRTNNLEREITARFPGQVAGGPVGVSVKQLRRMIDAMGNPDSLDDLLLSVDGGKLTIICTTPQTAPSGAASRGADDRNGRRGAKISLLPHHTVCACTV